MLQTTHSDDPNVQEKIDKLAKRDRKTEQFFRWVLKIMEWIIAGITLIALVGALGIEVVNMVTEGTAACVNRGVAECADCYFWAISEGVSHGDANNRTFDMHICHLKKAPYLYFPA